MAACAGVLSICGAGTSRSGFTPGPHPLLRGGVVRVKLSKEFRGGRKEGMVSCASASASSEEKYLFWFSRRTFGHLGTMEERRRSGLTRIDATADGSQEGDVEEEATTGTTLKQLDQQLATLADRDDSPASRPSLGPSTVQMRPVKREAGEQGEDGKVEWPEFSAGFLGFFGFAMLLLTFINNLLYRTILGPPVSRRKTEDAASPPHTLSTINVSVISSISLVSPEDWDACAVDASGVEAINPFILHDFFLSLEESKSVGVEEGWLPQHLVARDEVGNVLGVVPLYLKSHSYGEYVFDHAWANAYFRYGGSYYPKLQCCVPFTPASGPRILVREGPVRDQVFDGLCKAMQQLTIQMQASSVNVTFPSEGDWERMGKLGYLQRIGMQYHWNNRNYRSFDDFLMDLKQSKRKNIRQERKKIQVQNLKMKRLRGNDIKPYHWDAFYSFYRNTTDNKWGQAYLTRDFFHMMGSRMGDKVLLVVAEDGGELVGGALNLIGGDTLYGRNWGCAPQTYYPSLHFEACYYQAIEAAIEWGLKRVEAGAQGEHKIQRGYIPTATYSCHYIADPNFRGAIESFLNQETLQMRVALDLLEESSPFREGILETSDV